MNFILMENFIEVKDGVLVLDLNDIFGDVVCRDLLVVVGSIDICIVGRKFSVEVVCKEGMEFIFVRDGDNFKDFNVIKVGFIDWLYLFFDLF